MKPKPLFTIIARTCKRPNGTRRAVKSILSQTCKDWEILFLVDRAGSHPEGNMLWANSQFYHHRYNPSGFYCMAIDDDGIFVDDRFLEYAKNSILETGFPECVLTRSSAPKNPQRTFFHDLPRQDIWDMNWEAGERPGSFYGNGYNWIARSDIFAAFSGAYCEPRGGDWYFMTAMIKGGVDFVRTKPIVGRKSLGRGFGKNFESGAAVNWYNSTLSRLGAVKISDEEWRLYGAST